MQTYLIAPQLECTIQSGDVVHGSFPRPTQVRLFLVTGSWFHLSVFAFMCQCVVLKKKKALHKVKRYWSALCPSLWCSCGGRAEGPSPAETPWRYRVVIHRSVWSVLEESTVTWLVPRSELFVTTNTTEISNHLNSFNPTKEIFFFSYEKYSGRFSYKLRLLQLFVLEQIDTNRDCMKDILLHIKRQHWPASVFWC